MKLASELKSKWSRLVFDININYNDIQNESKNYISLISNQKREREESKVDYIEERTDKEEADNFGDYKNANIYKKATIPKKALCDFIKRPKSSVEREAIAKKKKI
jgi:hypothetical protein